VSETPKLKIPFDWVVVDAIGALLAALGVLGLTGVGARFAPILESTAASVACIVLGVMLMALSLVQILRHMRESARRGPGA
jgi:amino acid transporter